MSQEDRNERIGLLTVDLHKTRDTLRECRKKAPRMAAQLKKVVEALENEDIPTNEAILGECPSKKEYIEVTIGLRNAKRDIAMLEQDIAKLVKINPE